MMYDLDELKKQHGAKMISSLKSELQEELNKRVCCSCVQCFVFSCSGSAVPGI